MWKYFLTWVENGKLMSTLHLPALLRFCVFKPSEKENGAADHVSLDEKEKGFLK